MKGQWLKTTTIYKYEILTILHNFSKRGRETKYNDEYIKSLHESKVQHLWNNSNFYARLPASAAPKQSSILENNQRQLVINISILLESII